MQLRSLALHALVETHAAVARTRSRKQKIALLTQLCARLDGPDVGPAIAYLAGELPQGRIGLGPAAVFGAEPETAAEHPTLTLAELGDSLDSIANLRGKGSQAARKAALEALLSRCTEEGQDYLRKLIVGELRQGALEALLLEAVAQAGEIPADVVRRAAMVGGSLRDVATAALREGAAGLERFRLEPLRPLQPMLAQPGVDATAVLEALGPCAFEWKLDGARIQVHRVDDAVRVFTRSRNEVTAAVPEVVEATLALPARSLVLDGECIALDEHGRPRPFQETMKRFGRRKDVAATRERLPLSPFFFDLLWHDGRDLLEAPGEARAALLQQLVPASQRVERRVLASAAEAEAWFQAALDAGHEGLVAKALDAPYEAGRRGARWQKLKPAHTLDLVVLAAEWGSGRRQGFLSNLHLGARADDGSGYILLGKTFKGMTDETLRTQTEALLALETTREDHVVHVRPELVVEIALDGVQTSTQYPGGVALRFARLKRYRTDKSAAEADTLATVRDLLA